MKKLTAISLISALIVSSCGNKTISTETQSQADAVTHVALIEKEKFTGPIDTSAVVEDTIYIPAPYLLDDSTATCHLLQSGGTYHGSEIVPNAEKKSWVGLFNSQKGYYTSKTKIKVTHVYDGIMDEDTTLRTGLDITVLHKDTAVILFSGIDSLPQRPVSSLVGPRPLPSPDDTIRFSWKGRDYKLYSTALKRNNTWDLATYTYYNYKLYLESLKDGKEVIQVLRATSRQQAEYERILFIGDLDGDDIPDVIFDLSGENYSTIVLYLSKNAKPGSLLEMVTSWTTTGC